MFLSLFCHSNSSNIWENLLYGFRSDRRTCKQGQLSNEALYHLTLVFIYCNRVEEPDSNSQLFEADNVAGFPALRSTCWSTFYPILSGMIQRGLSYPWEARAHGLALLGAISWPAVPSSATIRVCSARLPPQ